MINSDAFDCELWDDDCQLENIKDTAMNNLNEVTGPTNKRIKQNSIISTKTKRLSKSREEAEYEKAKKKLLQIEQKNKKPGECLKHMLVMMDSNLNGLSFIPKVIQTLQDANVKCEQNVQTIPCTISFWRSTTTIIEGSNTKLDTKSEDVIQDQIIIYIPREEFISMLHVKNLSNSNELDLEGFVKKCFDLVGSNMRLTFIILKLDEYLKSLAGKKYNKSQAHVVDGMTIEQATLNLQILYRCHFKFVNSDDELSRMILSYTKSVAECPFKRELKSQCQHGSLYVTASKGCAKMGPEQTWRSQLNVFKNVTADVSNAIAREYPNPKSLFEKYLSCPDTKTAQHLLDDIVIRRGAGITATSRRIGPELSRKVHTLMTSRDGTVVIM